MTLQASGAISLFDVNTELGLTNNAQLGLLCTPVRTLFGDASGAVAMFDGYGKSNTSVPGAPTGVSASATSCSAISVSFSAPACTGHLSIDYYQVVCTGSGSYSATGSSSPISVTGLSPSTSYTFKVRAHNSKGYGSYSSSTGTASTTAVTGSYTNGVAGYYSWNPPAGVTHVSMLLIGAGSDGFVAAAYFCGCNGTFAASSCGGGSGAVGYQTNVGVSHTCTYPISVGAPNGTYNTWICMVRSAPRICFQGGYLVGSSTNSSGGGSYVGFTTGTNFHIGRGGYAPGYDYTPLRGGAGGGTPGYQQSGQGNNGGYGGYYGGCSGSCGGGGGGASGTRGTSQGGGGGGGLGLYGRGSNGSGGSYGGGGGGGGSSGSSGGNAHGASCRSGGNGGDYGAGGGSPGNYGAYGYSGYGAIGYGNTGAIRIIWPGYPCRYFPTTNTGSP